MYSADGLVSQYSLYILDRRINTSSVGNLRGVCVTNRNSFNLLTRVYKVVFIQHDQSSSITLVNVY